MTSSRERRIAGALARRPPTARLTVRFTPPRPRGADLVRIEREAAAGYRGLAAKNPPGTEHHKRLLAIADNHEANAAAEEQRLMRTQPNGGELFQ